MSPGMANKLGAAFLRCALGPLHYAAGLILSSKVAEGLNELSADSLHGGLRRGIEEAAGQVGVGGADVEGLLPMADIAAAAARLDNAQKGAVHAWDTYAGHIGGLMKGVADLTVDGRALDVSAFLARLSKKVMRDPPLSEPLFTLSVEIGGWVDLVERCGEILADGGVLAAAYRRRRLRRVAAAVAGGLVVAGGLGVGLWLHGVRARVDASLAAADPCAAEGIAPADLDRASDTQKERAAERRHACDEGRRREAAAREAARLADERARAEEQRKKEAVARCDALADHVASASALTPEDEATAGAAAALLGRVARGAVEKADLLTTDLPCDGSPAGAKIADAFAAALCASPAVWSRPDDVSDRVYAALVARRDALPGSPKQTLALQAETLSKRALVHKDDAGATRAMRICRLKTDIGIRGGKYCATVFAVAGKRE
jgi:hypothetical protein